MDNLSGQIQFVRLFFLALFGLKTLGYDAETYEMLGRNLWVMMKETMSCGRENYDLFFLTIQDGLKTLADPNEISIKKIRNR